MIVKRWSERKFLAQATVKNGRWGEQWIGVELYSDEDGDRIIYHDGHSDPLSCRDEATAMRFFNERVASANAS